MESGERESSDGNGVGGNICGEAFHAEGTAEQKPCSQEEVRVAQRGSWRARERACGRRDFRQSREDQECFEPNTLHFYHLNSLAL